MRKHNQPRTGKLALQPETLRALRPGQLEAVAGGITLTMPGPSPIPTASCPPQG